MLKFFYWNCMGSSSFTKNNQPHKEDSNPGFCGNHTPWYDLVLHRLITNTQCANLFVPQELPVLQWSKSIFRILKSFLLHFFFFFFFLFQNNFLFLMFLIPYIIQASCTRILNETQSSEFTYWSVRKCFFFVILGWGNHRF